MKIAALIFAILGALSALSIAVYAHAAGGAVVMLALGNYGAQWQFLSIIIPLMCILGAGILGNAAIPGSGILLASVVVISMFIGLNKFTGASLLLLAIGSCMAIAAGISEAPRGQRRSVVGRALGWLFLATGCFLFVQDLRMSLVVDRWSPIVLGQLWYNTNKTSLNLLQAGMQRYVSPRLWDAVIQRILLSWAFAVLGVIGAALIIVFRRRRLPAR